MDRASFVRTGVWLCALLLLTPATPRAGGLSYVEHEQRSGSNGLEGARALVVDGDVVYVVGTQDDSISAWRIDALNQLDFIEVQEDGVGGVDGLKAPVAIAATGSCVYVATLDNPLGPGDAGAVVAFSRTLFGNLGFIEVEREGVGGVDGIKDASAIAASLDGKHLYVTGEGDDAIAIFGRTAPACELTFLGVVKNGVGGVQGLEQPQSIDLDPFGLNVYVAASTTTVVGGALRGTVAVFDRDGTSGALTFREFKRDGDAGVDRLLPKVSAVAVSGSGDNVYATSERGDSIVAFSRDLGTGALTFLESEQAEGLGGASDVVTSASDDYVFATGHDDDALAVFKRDQATGTLEFLEVHDDPVPGTNVLGGASAVAIAYDFSGGVFVASSIPDTVVAFTADRCANGSLGVDEQCDDGNPDDGDGCSSTCRLELCGPIASGACHATTSPRGATLEIKDRSPDTRDQLRWSWKGQATPLVQFGDPVTTASYVVCIYDGSGNPQPLLSRAAPFGGVCDGRPCWAAKSSGFKYADKKLTPDGVKKAELKAGITDGKPRVLIQGAGLFIDPPALPLTLPLKVQVKNSQNNECWEAVYNSATINDPERFKAKSD